MSTTLSRLSLGALAPTASDNSISMSPPFILSVALDPSTAQVTAGLADGRVWVGCGGMTSKKGKKWGGLVADEGTYISAVNGPVVGV